ncbi:ATP-binding protein [Caballeronia sp. EK]|uniref:ATP-binding protein n=1 Tax=Caballeronia sp. EK TaxID=2767469 RepID=UPI0016561A02|nr:ATP-binding protein [Caballeronia sp. EK]MBC8642740.1 ATP-binding protein [Caballeronia sp. EK]
MNSVTFEQALHGSPNDKGAYIAALRFMHRNLEKVLGEVERHMIPSAGLSLTVVVGPAGVGKTTFAGLETEMLLKLYDVEIRENPGVIPVVLSSIDAADGKDINWQLFYQHLLDDLHTLSPDVPAQRDGQPVDGVKSYRVTFEKALRNRAVRHVLLDEAVHLTDSRTDPLQYGNLLKSLGNRGSMNLLLIGAYGSEKIVRASGQLARRISVVHFPRYLANQDDFDAFTQFIKDLAKELPLPFKVDLGKYVETLFEAHLGIPGYAVKTLVRSVIACAYDGCESWKDEYVWNALPSKAEYETIGAETLEGEQNIQPYLSSSYPIVYPSEAELLASLAARRARTVGDATRGFRR